MNYRRAQSRVAEVVENAPLERPDHVERPAAAPAEQVVPADPESLPRFRKNKGGHTRKDWKQIAIEKVSDESLEMLPRDGLERSRWFTTLLAPVPVTRQLLYWPSALHVRFAPNNIGFVCRVTMSYSGQ